MSNQISINQWEYNDILIQAVKEIRDARTLIATKVNKIANSVYWNLGKLLFEKQLEEGYESGVVKQHYQEDTKLLQSVAVLPWGHNLLLLDKVRTIDAVAFYANESILIISW